MNTIKKRQLLKAVLQCDNATVKELTNNQFIRIIVVPHSMQYVERWKTEIYLPKGEPEYLFAKIPLENGTGYDARVQNEDSAKELKKLHEKLM